MCSLILSFLVTSQEDTSQIRHHAVPLLDLTNTNTRSLNKLYKNRFNLSSSGFGSRLVCHGNTIRHRLISFSTALLPLGWCQVAVWRGIAVPEMVGAIKVLRDGFVRMEQMKNPLHQTSKVTFFFRFCLHPETESFKNLLSFHKRSILCNSLKKILNNTVSGLW